MDVKQIYQLVNSATQEVLGESALLKEDLGNLVDIGTALFNANAVDAYARKLVNHVGRMVFVNRPYAGGVPSVLMDSWLYGSVLEKVSAEMPEATENESWDLEDGASYDPNVFHKPTVAVKFYNKKVTFEIEMSFTELQLRQSFSSAEQMNGFLSMIYAAVDKSMTVKIDSLIMRTINNMIGETVYAETSGGSISSRTGNKAVNLLYMYNQQYSKSLTAAACLTDPDFIRYAAYIMGLYESRLSKISSLFNVGGEARFTPADMLHVVTLADFRKAAAVFLQSDTFNQDLVSLPRSEEVPYWQGSGTGYAFSDTGKVYITTASGHDVTVTGVLGIMFDRDALGVTNLDRRVTTNYNAKAEFYNNFYKFDCGSFNDTAENFVVFYAA